MPTMDTITKHGPSEERLRGDASHKPIDCRFVAVLVSLVGHAARKVAPIPRRGSRLGAPRSVAMGRLLDRLPSTRKHLGDASNNTIQDVPCVTRLTTCRFRFRRASRASGRSTSCARSSMRFDKSESYVVRRFADQMFRRRCDEKKFVKNLLVATERKNKNAARESGVHNV